MSSGCLEQERNALSYCSLTTVALGSTKSSDAWFSTGACFNRAGPQGEDFRFYKSGIYNNKKCSPKMKRLDHAVIVSGYTHCYLLPVLPESLVHASPMLGLHESTCT